MDFGVGQRVVCIDDSPGPLPDWPDNPFILKRDQIYTIAHLGILHGGPFGGHPGVRLREELKITYPTYMRFRASRFRPLEYKAMALFRQIAAAPDIKIKENV